ncbi:MULTISPECIES: multiple stress resistance protein BhsA [Yersinia]|uniref:multiple stress resistance protein BhsA n=1 Tax=Yersinia TaxID=629 RepID=UPI000EB07D3D|nr:YdgH/BhsA/McbA-like domain containing protein [Yersinia sp. IP36721]
MKNIKYIASALVLSLASFTSMASTSVNTQQSASLNKNGVISVSNAGTLTELENALAQKAQAAGAKSFQITSASGNNKLHGTAVIYQ